MRHSNPGCCDCNPNTLPLSHIASISDCNYKQKMHLISTFKVNNIKFKFDGLFFPTAATAHATILSDYSHSCSIGR